MKQTVFEIIENRKLAEGIYRLRLSGDTSEITAPGQFVNLKLDGCFLRRPISVCDWADGEMTLIYKVLGHGTEAMTAYPTGKKLDVLTGLGNGYDLTRCGDHPLLIGGGVGIPPLYGLAKRLTAAGKHPSAVLGFNSISDSFYIEEFKALSLPVHAASVDGSIGIKGFVTDAMAGLTYDYFYTCGPEAMLKAVYKATNTRGQFSFEERMGCGFGACMGCSCKTVTGYKRICKDGPVLRKEELLWEN